MFYVFVKLFFAPLVRLYLRFRVVGTGHVPPDGPVLLVANHASFLDPIVLGSACRRPIHFIVLQVMYDLWRLRWFYWGMNTIPARTEDADPRAIRNALSRLKRGDVVGVFPEGERSADGSIGEAKPGAALLAAASGAPVIPCAILGAGESWPMGSLFPRPGRVEVRFGEPFRYPAGKGARRDRAELARFSVRMMQAIADLAGDGAKRAGSADRGR